jgi:hypothetical protein
MSGSRAGARVMGPGPGAVRHFGRAVGETACMHRVSDRSAWRARVQKEWAP